VLRCASSAMAKPPWILLALCVFFASATLSWLVLNHAPAQWDDAWYLSNSLVMYDALCEGGLLGYAAQYLTILRIKAPLITLLPTPIYLVLGRKIRAAYLLNLPFMLAMFLLVYMIGRYRNSRTGLIAAYIIATMPLLYGLSRWFLSTHSPPLLVWPSIS